jgi:hypothetical protein
MQPSQEDIANFIAFAPDADEGKAFMFLEVSHLVIDLNIAFTDILQECEYRRGSCWTIL